jgi:hypothetical protein
MLIRRSYLGKIVLSVILISFVVLSSVLFLNLKVSSQNEETIQSKNMSNKQQKKKDEDKDGIQDFINTLTDNNKEIPPSKKVDAIKRLGDANKKRAIPILIKYLDYEDASVLDRNVNSINITEYNDISPARRYPAIASLVQMGEESLPALVEVVEKEPLDSTLNKNARVTIQYIFLRGNLLNGILYLEKASSESKVPNGSERLLIAAQELKKLLKKVQE